MTMRRAAVVGVGALAWFTALEAGAAPTVVAEVVLPGSPFDGIAVTPDGSRVYVSLVQAKNPGVNAIAVIDAATDTVVDVIALGDQGADNSSPRQLYMAPDGGLLIHATYTDNLIVVDTATDTVIASLPGVGSAVSVFSPDSSRLWSRDSNSKTLQVYDTSNMGLIKSFPLLSPGSGDFPLVMAPDGERVHAATSNEMGNGFNEPIAIDSFDAAGLTLTNHYGVGAGVLGNALVDARLSPDGARMYVSAATSTKVVGIEVATGEVFASADVPTGGEGLSLSPDGSTLYVFENGYFTGFMRVYATDTLALQESVDVVGQTARFIATSRQSVFAPSGCAVIVPAPLVNAIFAVDPSTHEKIATFATPGGTAYTVAFQPDSARAYVPWRTGATTGILTILELGEECEPVFEGPCTENGECNSDFCVDGVCCDSACGDGASDDCQACSVAQGAEFDGVCGAVGPGVPCRAGGPDECDPEEVCDGVALECPADVVLSMGEECDGGVCLDGTCEPEGGTTGPSTTSTTGETSTSSSGGEVGTSSGGAVSGTGETGEAPTSTGGPPGSGSDSDSASGGVDASSSGGGENVPTTSAGGETSGSGSGSDTAGETIDDGCGCAAGGGSGLLWWLPVLAVRRRRRAS
jgi:DNA-binding beta-propeller fold protein YncE